MLGEASKCDDRAIIFLIYTFVEPRLKIVVPRGSHQSNGTKVGTTPCIQYGKYITALGTTFGNHQMWFPESLRRELAMDSRMSKLPQGYVHKSYRELVLIQNTDNI